MKISMRFQPIVDMWTQSIIGYESTLRGEKGESAPYLFERACTHQEIIALDAQAVELSLIQGLQLLKGDQQLFINIHPRSLHSWFTLPLQVPLNKVVLEITEQTHMNSKMEVQFEALHNSGVSFAIDDFGKKNSNIDRLLLDWFHPNYLKLDKEFSLNLPSDRTITIIKNTVRLCQDTGIKLIVEGVETEQQKTILFDNGVRYMQGYYLGYPEKFKESSKKLIQAMS